MLYDPNELPALAPDIEQFLTDNAIDEAGRYMARKYAKDWGKASSHLDGAAINSWPALFMHARGEENSVVKNQRMEERQGRNERRKARASKEQFGTDWLAWQGQCSQRNAWIESLAAEWRKRVSARKAAMAEWDLHVTEARIAFNAAKATQAPPQPVKVAQ